jgi:hypothetical protein
MTPDDIIRGVRAAREAYAQLHNFDVHAMVADLRKQDEGGDWKVVKLPPRRCVVTVTPAESTNDITKRPEKCPTK